jgi:hypothetical protein
MFVKRMTKTAAIICCFLTLLTATQAQQRNPARVIQKPAAETKAKVLKNGLEIRGFRIIAADGATIHCSDSAKHTIYSNATGKPLTIAAVITTARQGCAYDVVKSTSSGSADEVVLSDVSDDVRVAEVTLLQKDTLSYRPAKGAGANATLDIAYSTYMKEVKP